ncbi:unnamed protein product [Heligmosomoides polygyrus]|uniref:Uncharacterized protein n=1 Tax=Heligmosomoides polygyrus TaxID=6339 RepID=A0A183FM35_HELPZ|nr:unnamed protein product [Heligmosomoides polygyrus]
MVHEVVVFLVDVVHKGIFPEAGKRAVNVSVGGCSEAPPLELCGLLSLTRKAEPRAKKAVVRSREELGTTETSARQYLRLKMMWSISLWNWPPEDFLVYRKEGGFWNCEFPWMILVNLINSGSLSPCSFHSKPWVPI